jgi:serine/threonine protein kinase/WD40 repeat protein/tetratricopeptide (TPR) repeat protein
MIDNDPSAADPFGQIADEFVEAFRQGKRPSVEEFARRYPEQADEIREMLPALLLMEKAKAADDAPGHRRPARGSAAAALQQVGDYQILREVGRGGMGVVYEAQQLSLGRHVAIKVLPSHALLDARQLSRFQREARAAAKLHHTNIVPVFGVGEQDGLHYYVMQFIQGLALDTVLNELRRLRQPRGKQVSTRSGPPSRTTHGGRDVSAVDVARGLLSGEFRQSEPVSAVTTAPGEPASVAGLGASSSARAADTSATIHLPGQSEPSTLSETGQQYWQSVARVGMQVADALAHASSQGVLHRDIKPANLLLDGTGNVWVTDFGLAKADSDGDNLTHTGDIVGTLRYMAPERFNGQGDLRSDVYSLGLTLYEMLALRPAFDEGDRNKLIKQVVHGEPVRPRKLNPAVPRDLETVVLKAVARDPAHRYQSPAEMADDLKRFVEDRPVRARRISEGERLWRWCRRNPLPASLLAGIVLVFLMGFAGVFWQWRGAEMARQDEKNQRNRVEALRQGAETARDEAEKSRVAAQAETYRAVLSEVKALRAGRQPGWREKALADLARLAIMPTPRRNLPELRTEAAATLGTPDIRLVARIALPSDPPSSIAFSPDGRALLTAGCKTGLDFWDVPGNRHLSSVEELTVSEKSLFDAVVYLPDGQGIAVGAREHGVVFTDSRGIRTTRAPITQGASKPAKLAISGNGRRLAVAWSDGAGTTVHDVASGAVLHRFKDSKATFALSPDGQWLACQESSDIVLLPIASGTPRIVLGRHGGASALAFSPSGAMLAAAFPDHTTVLWDVAKREQVGTLRGHRERVLDVAFSPDGQWIATGGLDYTTRIWETRTGQNVATLSGSSSPAFRVQWSATGEHLAVNMNNAREVFLYRITGRHQVQQWLTGHRVELRCVAAHPRRQRLTTSGYAELNSWDLSVPHPSPVAIGPNPGAVTSLAYSPDGSLLATASWRGSDPRDVVIRDANTGKARGRISVPQIVNALVFDPKGERLACGDVAGNVVVWDLATSRPVQQFATGSAVHAIVYLDHPRRLVTHGKDAVLLFNLESGKLQRKVNLAGGGIRTLVADRARSRLVVGFQSGAIGGLSLPELTPGPRIEKAHDGEVRCLALSPDGRLLASGSDHRVVLRDAKSFERLFSLPLWAGTLCDLTFDSRGRRLAIVGTVNDVDVWDLAALRDGLAAIGLAWDRPAPASPPSDLAPEGEHQRPTIPVIRRPGITDPVAFERARSLVRSGVGAFESGRWAEAIRDLRQARDLLRPLHQVAPRDGRVASNLGISLGFLSSALRNEHRPAEALASLKEARQVLEAIRQPSFVDLYNLACAYANLTTLVEPGAAPPTAAEREALANRAMEALRRSLAAGMNNFALMERDRDLDPLRGRSDFRALILESSGRTREAVEHLAALSAANPKDTMLSLKVAALQAWFGQDRELAATRQRILSFARGSSAVGTAERAARACSIRPSTDRAELEATLALAGTGVKGSKREWALLALGMAEHRSGNHAAADKALLAATEAGRNNPCATGISAFYRAMSLFRQGKSDEARKLALAARALMKPLPADENNPLAGKATHDDLILWLVCKEAKALIQFDAAPPAKAEEDDRK